jgi:quinol monooxygenase YgiN
METYFIATKQQRYLMQGKLIAKPGRRDDLAKILLKGAEHVGQARGCVFYLIGTKEDDPDAVYITEMWESLEDHHNSLKDPREKETMAQAVELLIFQIPGSLTLEIVGGVGL